MTNAEIIMRESIELMEKGILKGVDDVFVDENGEEVAMKVPEEIHTFKEWKRMGRIVKKGETHVAKFAVWVPTKKTQKMLESTDGELDEKQKKEASMYLRTACWFTREQTQTVEEAEADREARRKAKEAEEEAEIVEEVPEEVEVPEVVEEHETVNSKADMKRKVKDGQKVFVKYTKFDKWPQIVGKERLISYGQTNAVSIEGSWLFYSDIDLKDGVMHFKDSPDKAEAEVYTKVA